MPTALVTGAAGGIGQAVCRVLTQKGYRVIGLDRHAADCAAEGFVVCDLRDVARGSESARLQIEAIREFCGGRLDLLVNNAAIQIVKPADQLTAEDWDRTLAVNVTAPFLLAQAFLPEIEAAQGAIVNVGSIHANLTKPHFVAYATSKGALATMTKALAVELGPRGIRVNAILPAATETPMLVAGFADHPEQFRELSRMHPVGRIAQPEELGELIAFLGSPNCGFLTGSTIAIDGAIGARLHDPV
ncbi:MAG: SDR family oxidoreductase [Sumerlaeia bacterium]